LENVLLTGASGFVGANLARDLLARGKNVHLLLRPQAKLWRIHDLLPHVRVYWVDMNDAEGIKAAVQAIRPHTIYHLAVYGAYPSQTNMRLSLETNLIGTMNLIEACTATDFAVFLNTGSSSEYGFQDHAPREDELPQPNSDYAFAKTAATLYCAYQSRRLGRPISTLRLYSVYGPYEEGTRLLPTLIKRGLNGDWPPMADPRIARDFIYIDDVCAAYRAVESVKELGAVFNVGTGIQTTLGQVAETARAVLGLTGEPPWGDYAPRAWDTSVWVADPARLRQACAWTPQFDFQTGFATMVAWFREHEALYAD